MVASLVVAIVMAGVLGSPVASATSSPPSPVATPSGGAAGSGTSPGPSTSGFAPVSGWQAVTFGPVRFRVPADWPVVNLAEGPSRCVRFDVHAAYLGTQGLQPTCPAGAIGRTEAVDVQSLDDRTSAGVVFGPPTRVGREPARVAPFAGTTRSFTVAFPRLGVLVTATFGEHRGLAWKVVSSVEPAPIPRSLPASPVDVIPATVPPITGSVASRATARTATGSRTASAYVGRGFDACTAPSLASMTAWLSSPYKAIGIYVGGANRGCSQPNLTASWVASAETLGWNLMPLYVGLQAPCASQRRLALISTSTPTAQGRNAADDAVVQAANLGLGIGSPIYFDMEAYDSTKPTCVITVEKFLSAWTAELHVKGYVSGVYGSSGSTIKELAAYAQNPNYASPDDIWFANWNGTANIFGDPYFSDTLWPNHQRIHQFRGGHTETYSGIAINIDSSQVDGAVIGRPAEGSFVRTLSGRRFRIAGGAPVPVTSCSALGGCRPIETLSTMSRLARYPKNGTVIASAERGDTYVVAGTAALPVDMCVADARCSQPIALEQSTIDSLGGGHLRRQPLNGTQLSGVPSGDVWRLWNGCRSATGSPVSPVSVSDVAVAALFPICLGTLVFDSGPRGHRHVVRIGADGTGRVRLTGASVDAFAPALSPDGTKIAFTRVLNGNADVWVMNANGTGARRLTAKRAFDGFPSWSPDGTTIAFQSDRAGNPDIWTITADGLDPRRLTLGGSRDRRPVWSPDRTRIAFESDRTGSFDLWTMNPDGTAATALTSGQGDGTAPSWSPDGTQVVFQSDRAGNADIWTVGADGTGRRQLTTKGSIDASPSWSPDGGRIAFVSDRGGATQIFVMHADGTVVLRYTGENTPPGRPRWSSP